MRIRIKEKLRIRKIMCVTLKGYGFCKTDKIVILHTHLVAATTVCLSSVVMLLSAPSLVWQSVRNL